MEVGFLLGRKSYGFFVVLIPFVLVVHLRARNANVSERTQHSSQTSAPQREQPSASFSESSRLHHSQRIGLVILVFLMLQKEPATSPTRAAPGRNQRIPPFLAEHDGPANGRRFQPPGDRAGLLVVGRLLEALRRRVGLAECNCRHNRA